MGKKKGNNFRPFEGRKVNDRHVRITKDMMTSDAWGNLKPTSIALYLFIKLRFNGTNQNSIEFPYTEAEKLGISRETTRRCFKELIELGFIEVIFSGRFNRKANVYKLSDRWQSHQM